MAATLLFLLVFIFIRSRIETSRRNQVRLEVKIAERTKEIRLQKTKIEEQKGLFAGLKINTAWKGLVVSYGKWNEILISPAEEEGFIAAIKAKNPTLKV
mgnify:CR=1 FL=1